MFLLKKLIKYFVPYGFFDLQYKIKMGFPLISHSIKRNDNNTNYFCDTVISKTIDDSSIIKICREDYEHSIYLRNHTSDIEIYRAVIDNNEYDFFAREEPKYIIDAGANIGTASIYFTRKYKDAKVIAIEPEEANYKILKLNTENYPNITAINAALWNTSGEITLFDTGLDNVGFMTGTNSASLKPSTKDIKHLIKSVTVSEIMHEFNIDHIDILKIDIEGAEKEVFESCRDWIHKTRCIIVELHERMKKGCNKAFYKSTKFFDKIGVSGENIFLSKENYIEML